MQRSLSFLGQRPKAIFLNISILHRSDFGGRRPTSPPPRGTKRGCRPLGAAAKQRGVNVADVPVRAKREQKKSPVAARQPGTLRTAATYSPNWWVSTIGAGELNCSVRNGKRWNLTAITTALCYLREKNHSECLPAPWISFQIFATSWLIFLLGKSIGPLVQVS